MLCPLNCPSPTDENIEALKKEIEENRNKYGFRVILYLQSILKRLEEKRDENLQLLLERKLRNKTWNR